MKAIKDAKNTNINKILSKFARSIVSPIIVNKWLELYFYGRKKM
jgi:hypothetical protein